MNTIRKEKNKEKYFLKYDQQPTNTVNFIVYEGSINSYYNKNTLPRKAKIIALQE